MAHILVAAMPFAGHVRPMAAVAAALLERGHAVSAYTGAKYTDAFAGLGCAAISWSAAQDFDDARLAETFPGAGKRGARGMIADVRDVFIGTARGQVDDLEAAHGATPFDAIVADVMAIGAGLTAELLHIPWGSVSVVPLWMPSRDLPPSGLLLTPGRGPLGRARDAVARRTVPLVTAPLDRPYRAVRESLGLAAGARFDTALYSPSLVLATGCLSLELPRTDVPASVRFVGRLAQPRAPQPAPGWVQEMVDDVRPIVFVTQGTLDTEPDDLLLPALAGLADAPVHVIGTTAGRRVAGRPPANARLVDSIPFPVVVPHAAVGVTNGGWGGVLEMLSMGLPLAIGGSALDKPQIAARVAWAGAGIDLRTRRPRPAKVRAAVWALRRDRHFKERAIAISNELEQLGGAAAAAALIESELLAMGGAPSPAATDRELPPEPRPSQPPQPLRPEPLPPEQEPTDDDVILARGRPPFAPQPPPAAQPGDEQGESRATPVHDGDAQLLAFELRASLRRAPHRGGRSRERDSR